MTQADHIPVLLKEVLDFIQPQSKQNFIDATLGGGGYTVALLNSNGPIGKVMCFDLDDSAILLAQEKLSQFQNRIIYINDNYSKIKSKVDEYKFDKIGGIVCDLGYSYLQIKDKSRGFSFESQGELDLRYNKQTSLTGTEVINNWSEKDIAYILTSYGEEPLAKRIANKIVLERKKTKITGLILRQIVERVYAKKWATPSRIHPATRTWQALRIAVNDELVNLKLFLEQSLAILPRDSRLAIVSFHSLED
jgi:16S rRNA (cytosine1402-N4)-methyltransferase